MCLLLALRDLDACRLWVAANRDERVSRPWQGPALLSHDPPVFGGLDLQGGGTWLAVNLAAGFLVGVTNARLGARAGRRSRGQLVYDAAAQATLADAVALVAEVDVDSYGPFNLLLANTAAAFVATNYPQPRVEAVEDRLIALGNERLGAEGTRTQAALGALGPAARKGGSDLAAALAQLLADHAGADPFCRHVGPFGTVCSTICELRGVAVQRYLFAAGPPCRTPFLPVPLPTTPYS